MLVAGFPEKKLPLDSVSKQGIGRGLQGGIQAVLPALPVLVPELFPETAAPQRSHQPRNKTLEKACASGAVCFFLRWWEDF